jgi:nitrate/nitrite transport system ATP-binding protein
MKTNPTIGFIPLTDCAPIIIAKEKGFFAEEGLDEVVLQREPNWKAIAQGVATGRLDAAQMVAGMPLSMTIGAGDKPSVPVITALVLSRNGNAITLSNKYKELGVYKLGDLKAAVLQSPDKIETFGMVHPASMHNLLLRYWLASGGIDPDSDVNLTVIPPPQMVSHLKAGNIDGYCVGEPWNSYAVHEKLGYVIATDLDIWPGHPEKVLGVKESWAAKYPETHIAMVKALIKACEYCDDRRNREEIVTILSQPQYVGADPEIIRPGFLDGYDRGLGNPPETLLRFNQFYVDQANCPGRGEGLWILTQLARWGYAPFPRNWVEILERVRRPDLFGEACRELGISDVEPDRHSFALFDNLIFNPDDPIGYLERLSIRRDYRVSEVLLDDPVAN